MSGEIPVTKVAQEALNVQVPTKNEVWAALSAMDEAKAKKKSYFLRPIGNFLLGIKPKPPVDPLHYPPMMKLPPDFSFYPFALRTYHGRGIANGKLILLGMVTVASIAGVLFTFLVRATRTNELPSHEVQAAQYERYYKVANSQPIRAHKVGAPVQPSPLADITPEEQKVAALMGIRDYEYDILKQKRPEWFDLSKRAAAEAAKEKESR